MSAYRFNEKQVGEMVTLYLSGRSTVTIGALFHANPGTIRDTLHRAGVELRRKGQSLRLTVRRLGRGPESPPHCECPDCGEEIEFAATRCSQCSALRGTDYQAVSLGDALTQRAYQLEHRR